MNTSYVTYQDEDTKLEAFFAYKEENRPLILIFHAWKGRDEFVIQQAKYLADLGYVGCALDMYGKGVIGRSTEENGKLMQPFINDREYLQRRALKGLDMAQKRPFVDPTKVAAIGFCFGGLCVLDLARSGAMIQGVVSFHGLLRSNNLAKKNIKAKVLVLHGKNDPMVPQGEVVDFQEEMEKAKADWQLHIYGDTMHAFTNPEANDSSLGTMYNPIAEKRAFLSMRSFLKEIFSIK